VLTRRLRTKTHPASLGGGRRALDLALVVPDAFLVVPVVERRLAGPCLPPWTPRLAVAADRVATIAVGQLEGLGGTLTSLAFYRRHVQPLGRRLKHLVVMNID
jgi:hypothetical protein